MARARIMPQPKDQARIFRQAARQPKFPIIPDESKPSPYTPKPKGGFLSKLFGNGE